MPDEVVKVTRFHNAADEDLLSLTKAGDVVYLKCLLTELNYDTEAIEFNKYCTLTLTTKTYLGENMILRFRLDALSADMITAFQITTPSTNNRTFSASLVTWDDQVLGTASNGDKVTLARPYCLLSDRRKDTWINLSVSLDDTEQWNPLQVTLGVMYLGCLPRRKTYDMIKYDEDHGIKRDMYGKIVELLSS